MKSRQPSKEEQIESLIHNNAYGLVSSCCGLETVSGECYKRIFNISRSEMLAYIKAKYQIDERFKTQNGIKDGLYAIRQLTGYHVFYQEHRRRFDEIIIGTENALWEYYLDHIIRYSGTGLTFRE